MTFFIRIDKSVPIEMRDGTILRADIYQPDDNEKHPAILVRTLHNRQVTFDRSFLPYEYAVWSGYAVIIENIRGVYDSGGQSGLDDDTLTIERPDSYDSIEWVAAQPWCDGNVGTCGASYLGRIQWIAAQENPPHLKAMSPWVSNSGAEVPASNNGIVKIGMVLNGLLNNVGVENIDRQEKLGKDTSSIRQLFNQAVADPSLVYNYLPLKDVPHFNFEHIREMWTDRIFNSEQDTPEFVEQTRTRYEKIKVPGFHVSGWYDFNPSGTIKHFLNMREKGGTEFARHSQHLLMGPWTHDGPTYDGVTGALGFGRLSTIIGSQLGEYILAFFNKYLRGMKVDLPVVRYFVMGKNIWQTADNWPLFQTHWQRFFLHSRGHANSSAGDGLLSRDEPGAELFDTYIYNPHFPVPTTGCHGHHQLIMFAPSPQEQSLVEHREDVLCYTTPELKEDLEVTGPLMLHLFAASSARDTDFTAKIVDVYPDGRAYGIVDGIIRARYRKSLFAPELLIPGEISEYVINLEATSQLFRKGHRIRIDITSSNFPEFDRNMNTGNAVGKDAQGIPALQSIYHQSGYASYIDLPVIESAL